MTLISGRAKRGLPKRGLLLAGRDLLAGTALLVLTLAAGCSSGSQSATDTAAQDGAGSSGVVINFGDQQQYTESLLAASGALTGASYKVNFVEFDSGPLVDAGFAAGRIDVGTMGDLPASLAVKSGLPVTAIAAEQYIGASMYLVARPGITSVAQLRGKSVAYTTGTAEQAFALRALATAGLTQRDVHQVDVSLLQLGTVLESGSADASVVSVEQKVDYQRGHPGSTVLATVTSVKPASYGYILGAMAALASPAKLAAIDDLTRRLIRAETWERSHQSQFIAAYYVTLKHQTPAVARQILAAGGTYDFVPLTSAQPAALQDVVNLLASAGALPAPYSVAPLFNSAESQRYNTILKEVASNGYKIARNSLVSHHPVVRVHPRTGEKVLFVNPVFTDHILDVSPVESRLILGHLFDELTRPEYQVRFRWEPGSVAFWDNQATAHLGPQDLGHLDVERVLHRVTLIGTVPVGPDGRESDLIEGTEFVSTPVFATAAS